MGFGVHHENRPEPNVVQGSRMMFTKKQYVFLQKFYHFTPRPMEIIRGMCEGLTDDEICQLLKIAHKTLGSHLWNIGNKAATRGKFELLRKFI